MKVVITRHGQTSWNLENEYKFQGSSDVELSNIGKDQAIQLANRLKKFNFDIIYSSPLKRAYETAKEVFKNYEKADLVVLNDLKEINFGVFEGFTKNEIILKFPKIWAKRERNKMNYKFPKGESLNEVKFRAEKVLNKIFSEKKDVLIVGHAVINQFFFMKLLEKSFDEINSKYYDNCAISIFNIDESGNIEVELFSDSTYLI